MTNSSKELNNYINYQDILKIIALISMIIDHIGCYLLPEEKLLRYIGRYAFPIFSFFAGYNFKRKINYKLLNYGCLLQIFTDLYIFQSYTPLNMLLAIFLGQLYLKITYSYYRELNYLFGQLILLLVLLPLTNIFSQYGTLTIIFMVIGYLNSGQNFNQLLIKLTADQKFYYSILLVVIMSYLYNVTIFYQITNLKEFAISLFLPVSLFFLLVAQKFEQNYLIKLQYIRYNLLNIYCVHLIIILMIRHIYQ